MTTRSGQSYKGAMSTEDTREETPRTEETITSGSELSGMSSIVEMMRTLIEDRERREQAFAEERERRERQRQEEMHTQMEMMQRLINARPAAPVPRVPNEGESMKLARLAESDDIEAYLTTFERVMEAYEVNRARWSFKLAPQLTGKAQQAYAALPPDDAKDYSTVKAAILRRYNINEETYWQRFRTLKLRGRDAARAYD